MRIHFAFLPLLFAASTLAGTADPGTTTPEGCQCKSECGATLSDKFHQDWCKTSDKCGQKSFVYGYWDYCLYKDDNRPEYKTLDWKSKHDLVWNKVTADNTMGQSYPTDAFTESLMTVFENEWDFLPEGRRKAIHGTGVVCPIKMQTSADSPFTGLFAPNQEIHGFMRMGPASDFSDAGLVPGIGIKFLRTGTKSANFLLLNSLEPLPDKNFDFFAAPVSNHLPDTNPSNIPLKLLKRRFCTTGHCITKVGLSNVCSHDQNGNVANDNIFPFKVIATPSGLVNFSEEMPASVEDFMAQFDAIQSGTKIYSMTALRSPSDEGLPLGDIIATDNCVTSHYGDTKLAFKHQWIEEDIDMKPEWADSYYEGCACNMPQ